MHKKTVVVCFNKNILNFEISRIEIISKFLLLQ